MKRTFIAFQYAPKQTGGATAAAKKATEAPANNNDADKKDGEGDKPSEGEGEQTPPPPPPPAEPTSEKLEQIRKDLDAKLDQMATTTDRKQKLELVVEIQRLQQAETTEIANIKRAIMEAEINEKRNARIALADDLVNAVLAERDYFITTYQPAPTENVDGVERKPQDVMDEMNRLTDATKKAREVVVNELVAKYASSTATARATDGTTAASGSRGETSKKIIELWEKNRAAAMSDTDNVKNIIEAGYARGTVGAVTLAWRREHGEVKD